MEVEHDIKVIPVNDKLGPELEKLQREGWTLVPGIMPVAIYHVVRAKQQHVSAPAGFGTLHIDESKIGILRDGKLLS